MSQDAIDALVARVKSEIDFVFSNLKNTPLVLCNKFSSLVFGYKNIRTNQFDKICNDLNDYLVEKAGPKILLVEIDKIIADISVAKSVDFRYYYSSKAIYTIDFYKSFSEFILPVINSVNGRSKKALIFDCDNTLWKGILGEDGNENIQMSGETKSGVVFEEVQHLAIAYNKKGILIGLCSKNNEEDVAEVFTNHADITLQNENIAIKKINWNDKVSNLKAIANELNIGLDSLIFIDDSDFEIGLVKEYLPKVTTLLVPANLYEYPRMVRDIQQLCFSVAETEEDKKRAQMYLDQAQRLEQKSSFNDIEEYLTSLELAINIQVDDVSSVGRIAQLTQKTNQFNLTTKRYTESEINNLMVSDKDFVLSISVTDKFGDSGLTAISIVNLISETEACIDSYLMSCRILGRNIEFSVFNFIIEFLEKKGISLVQGQYSKTFKNSQVADFYEKVGFTNFEKTEAEKKYSLKINEYKPKNINYININHGK